MGNVVPYFHSWPLVGGEFIAFADITMRQIIDADPVKLGVEAMAEPLSELTQKARLCLQATTANPLTKAKNEAEEYRDNRYTAFVAFVRNAFYDNNVEIATTAEDLLDVINAIGSPTNLGESKATAAYYNLFTQLEPLTAKVVKIGADARLNDLKEAHETYIMRQKELFAADGQKPSSNLRSVRMQWVPLYKSAIYRINALAEVNGHEAYQAFADAHNQTIAHYKNLIAQNAGRREAKKATATAK